MTRYVFLFFLILLSSCAEMDRSKGCADESDYMSPMHMAILTSNVAMVKQLLESAEYPPGSQLEGTSYIAVAASHGTVDVLNEFILHGYDVNKMEYDMSPLMCAADSNRLRNALLLGSYGADPSVKNKFGESMYRYACMRGSIDVVVLQTWDLIFSNLDRDVLFLSDQDMETMVQDVWKDDVSVWNFGKNGSIRRSSKSKNVLMPKYESWSVENGIIKMSLVDSTSGQEWMLPLSIKDEEITLIRYDVNEKGVDCEKVNITVLKKSEMDESTSQ